MVPPKSTWEDRSSISTSFWSVALDYSSSNMLALGCARTARDVVHCLYILLRNLSSIFGTYAEWEGKYLFGLVYPCQMKRICSKVTQYCSPWSVAHSTITGRISRGFFHWAFPRQSVTRVLQPLPHTKRKQLWFSPFCKTVLMLYSLPVCPKMCCLLKASRWVKWYGCKSLSPHYYCRVRCRWWRADIAILWVYCLRNLLFWDGIRSSPDPAAWVSEDWKIEPPGFFCVNDFLLCVCFPTLLVKPQKQS